MANIMKGLKWLILLAVGIIVLICVGLVVTGNSYIFRGLQLNYLKGEVTANIDDYIDIIVRLGKQKGQSKRVDGFHLEPDLGQYVTEVKKIVDALPSE